MKILTDRVFKKIEEKVGELLERLESDKYQEYLEKLKKTHFTVTQRG